MTDPAIAPLLRELSNLFDAESFHQSKLKDRPGYGERSSKMTEQEVWARNGTELSKSMEFLETRHRKREAILVKIKQLCTPTEDEARGLAPDIPWGSCCFEGKLNGSFRWKQTLPFERSFCGSYTPRMYSFVRDAILELILRSAHGAVRVLVLDTHTLGSDARPLRPLLSKNQVLTHMRQVEEELNHLTYRIADFHDEAGISNQNWAQYKGSHPQDKTPYTILLVLNAQELFIEGSSTQKAALERVLRQGPAAGIVSFLLYNKEACPQKQQEEFKQFLIRSCVQPLQLGPPCFKEWAFEHFQVTWTAGVPYSKDQIANMVEQAAARMGMSLPSIESLWKHPITRAQREEGLCIPIGWNAENGLPSTLELNDTTPHCFIGGQTGSGKSNLLHVILHSLLSLYSPEELQLYVLDFKQGVEMKLYADAHPRAVRCIATQSDTEFASALLQYLQAENDRRIRLFPNDLNNISKYNRRTKEKLPRIVLIIDECQHLFQQGSFRNSMDISRRTEQLVRQGRSQGIHMIFCTQTLVGMDMTNKSLWNNIPARIALFCKASDSAAILAPDNAVAASIQSPGQAVLNLQNGNRDANIIVNVPKLQPDMEVFQNHIRQLSAPNHCVKFYDGASCYPLPPEEEFVTVIKSSSELFLGYHIDYDSTPFMLPLFDPDFEACTAMAVTWGTPNVRRAMRAGVLRSAAAAPSIAQIYYIFKGYPPDAMPTATTFVPAGELTPDKMEEIFKPASANQQKLVYIQDWDLISELEIASEVPFLRSASKHAASPFKRALDSVEEHSYVHIVAEVKVPSSPNSTLRSALKAFRSYMVQGISPRDGAAFIGLDVGSPLSQLGSDEQHRNNVVWSNKGSEPTTFHGFTLEKED